jgi:hypothetical protein
MNKTSCVLAVLAGVALVFSAQAVEILLPGEVTITNPVPGQSFEAGVTNVAVGWTAASDASTYTLKVLHNGKFLDSLSDIAATDAVLDSALFPGYYSLFVRGSNVVGVGNWSSNATFLVRRTMNPDGTVSNRQPKVFRWTRSEPATRYLLKLAQMNKTTGKYELKREVWIPQPATGAPKWVASLIPDGKYRWTITDYKVNRAGYTQAALFQIKNSGHTTWNDPALIKGTWKVVTEWRWHEMTFQADGMIRVVQGDGATFTRAHWSADEKILTMVSDVTEKCPYTVTENTLTFKLPSGNVKFLTRIR